MQRRSDGATEGSGAPLFLVSTVSSARRVVRCCWRSMDAGVRPGMTLAHARALVPDAAVIEHDAARDAAAMRKLAEWSGRFSPVVGVDDCSLEKPEGGAAPECPDGLVLDISGCERAFRGEANLAFAIAAGLRRLGFEARIGIGPSMGAAWAGARFGIPDWERCSDSGNPKSQIPNPISPFAIIRSSREVREKVAPLPVAALRISAKTEAGLRELGIERVEQVLALPRRALPSRFGPELTRRIDQLFGEAMELIEPVRPAPPLRIELMFDGPSTQQEAIEQCARELTVELCRELLSRESGVRVLRVECQRLRENARGVETVSQRVTLSRPSRDAKHVWSLLRPLFERLFLGFGIEGVALVAERTSRVRHGQVEIEERHQGRKASRLQAGYQVGPQGQRQREEEVARLVDTLVNRLGEERVARVEAVESHIPERSFRVVGVNRSAGKPGFSSRRDAGRPIRPPVLFEAPEEAEAVAMMPDRPPSVLRWRGEELKVALGVGPERIGSEWWRWSEEARQRESEGVLAVRGALSPRDYFRVRDEGGRWLWVYREVYTGRWYVHGVWG